MTRFQFTTLKRNQAFDTNIPLDIAVIIPQNSSSNQPKKQGGGGNTKSPNENHNDQDCCCMCSMTQLISHLYHLKIDTCPVCSKHTIDIVYDAISHLILVTKERSLSDFDTAEQEYDIISFRFHKQSYHLTVPKQQRQKTRKEDHLLKNLFVKKISSIIKRKYKRDQQYYEDVDIEILAQERIGKVLSIDYKRNMKILHKGKLIYPTHGMIQNQGQRHSSNGMIKSPEQQLSQQLIDISNDDRKQNKRHPSLTIMGTRQNDILIEKSSNKGNNYPMFSIIMDRLRYIVLNHGFDHGLTLVIIVGGMIMFWKQIKLTKIFEAPIMEL